MIKKIDILSELRARGRFSHSEMLFLCFGAPDAGVGGEYDMGTGEICANAQGT